MSDNEHKIKMKVEKELETFVDVVNGMGRTELKDELFRLANYREEVELAKKGDEGLKEAQETARGLAAPYNDAVKALKLKTAYVHIILKEKGAEVEQVSNG